VAIPAVMAYNYFNSRIRVLASEMESFSNDFLNIVKRHTKPSGESQIGGIIEKEAPIPLSNVMLVCPKCDETTRVKIKILGTDFMF